MMSYFKKSQFYTLIYCIPLTHVGKHRVKKTTILKENNTVELCAIFSSYCRLWCFNLGTGGI